LYQKWAVGHTIAILFSQPPPTGILTMTERPASKVPPFDWRRLLQPDRPVYRCSDCTQPALQFHAELPDGSGRRKVFRCFACGLIREL
jgi:hypothetical protein